MGVESVIFIRRDNIGDLVCTTPAISATRRNFPDARIGVLVNSYNADVVVDNPDIDEVFVYEKEKHSLSKGKLRVLLSNLNLIRKVRAAKYEIAIGCSYGYSKRVERYASLTGAKTKIGFAPKGGTGSYDKPVPEPEKAIHEVEAMMRLVEPLGIKGPPPPLRLIPDEKEIEKVSKDLRRLGLSQRERPIIFHISSRKPQNRWPKEKFRALGDMIYERHGLNIILLWSPGAGANPLHPGDDENAEWLFNNMKKRPFALKTEKLSELIAAMSLGHMAVCSDGGAMHIAAALRKPVLTIWGSTDKTRWAPWGVAHAILQDGTGEAGRLGVDEAFKAFDKLYSKYR